MNFLKDFFKLEAAGGILLVLTAGLAIIIANTPLGHFYQLLLDMPVEVRIGPLLIAKPLLLWINDGLMAIFFFLVGLELKREIVEGELSNINNIAFPTIGAIGGMIIPAVIYALINWGDALAIRGWAIPAATDIAFALGILMLLGKRVPTGLKVFLVSVAIIDDIGAIIIIALFYTSELSLTSLLIGAALLPALFIFNRKNIMSLTPYLFVGLIMWTAVLKSGVHATLAGVVVAFFIPLRCPAAPERSPLKELEHDLHNIVAFGLCQRRWLPAGRGAGLYPAPRAARGRGWPFYRQADRRIRRLLAGRQTRRCPPARGHQLDQAVWRRVIVRGGFYHEPLYRHAELSPGRHASPFDERLGIIVGSVVSGIAGYLVLHWAIGKKA